MANVEQKKLRSGKLSDFHRVEVLFSNISRLEVITTNLNQLKNSHYFTRWNQKFAKFGYVRYNLAAPEAFDEVVNVTIHIRAWDTESSDTLSVLRSRFISMAWSAISKSMLLSLTDLARSLSFLRPELNFFKHLVTVQWSTVLSRFHNKCFW